MASNRYVNTAFWDDDYILSLDPEGKLLFIFAFTNPKANIAGAYQISLGYIEFHTRIPRIAIEAWLQKFKDDGKGEYRDGWMLMINTVAYQQHTSPKIAAGIQKIVSGCPDWIKDRLSIRYDTLSHLNLNLNLNLNLKNGGETPLVVAADAAADKPDKSQTVWEKGVKLLSASGSPERSARSLLGRLAKQYTEPELAAAINATLTENPIEPTSFLIGVLKKRAKDKAGMYVGAYNGEGMLAQTVQLEPCDVCGSETCLQLHRDRPE